MRKIPDLTAKKVGIIASSGKKLPEGIISRLATLKVLESLRPMETVIICLLLFLAAGENDRAFARLSPTVAVDGCEKRCAFRGTQKYSNTPAAGFVVSDLIPDENTQHLGSARQLTNAGKALAYFATRQTVVKRFFNF